MFRFREALLLEIAEMGSDEYLYANSLPQGVPFIPFGVATDDERRLYTVALRRQHRAMELAAALKNAAGNAHVQRVYRRARREAFVVSGRLLAKVKNTHMVELPDGPIDLVIVAGGVIGYLMPLSSSAFGHTGGSRPTLVC